MFEVDALLYNQIQRYVFKKQTSFEGRSMKEKRGQRVSPSFAQSFSEFFFQRLKMKWDCIKKGVDKSNTLLWSYYLWGYIKVWNYMVIFTKFRGCLKEKSRIYYSF